MAISDSQLQIWTNSPSGTKSQYTYDQVKKALAASKELSKHTYEVYLQGSYANSTNIRIDSDIDIVVQLNSSFISDKSNLSLEEKMLYSKVFSKSDYSWNQFRVDVFNALKTYFNLTAVKQENKCIKLPGNQNRVNADIIPCIQHRKYNSFSHYDYEDFIEGMRFWTQNEKKEIINYPKIHLENGEDKNADHRTDEVYKHLVRITKNIRRLLVESGSLDPHIARSYFVECAIYNAPDTHFNTSYGETLVNVFDFILNKCNPSTLTTVSHQHLLFGEEPWQWKINHAAEFFQKANEYYQNN